MNDQDTTIAELKARTEAFKAERGWGKHHTPENLAKSISIEASELLEHFQWDDYATSNKDAWEEELADIINYCLSFASVTGIDITAAIEKKLDKVAKKYPTSIFNPAQDSADDYWAIKKKYREGRE